MKLIGKFNTGWSASNYYVLGECNIADAIIMFNPADEYLLCNGKSKTDFSLTKSPPWLTWVKFEGTQEGYNTEINEVTTMFRFNQSRFIKTELEKVQVRTALETITTEEERKNQILILSH